MFINPFLQEKSKTDIQQLAPEGTSKGKLRTPTQTSESKTYLCNHWPTCLSSLTGEEVSSRGRVLCILSHRLPGVQFCSFFSLETFKGVKKIKRNFNSGWFCREGNFDLCDAGVDELVCGESYNWLCSEMVSLRLFGMGFPALPAY